MITKAFADIWIKDPSFSDNHIKNNYVTQDIVKAVLQANREGWRDTKEFSKRLVFKNLEDISKQLFDFLLFEIIYKEDDFGSQVVKKPSALWYHKQGDCKSYTIFVTSVMQNLGIPYTIRFVSYAIPNKFTHVYPIAHGKDKDIIIDAVYKKFNKEKPYKFKKDYTMKGLHIIGATGEKKSPTMLNFKKPVDELSEADLELEIIRQRAEIEKEIVGEMRGIGSTKYNEYQRFCNGINAIIAAVDNNDLSYINGFIAGHPDTIGKLKLKKLIKKITKPVKKATKAVLKPAKKVVKAAAKGAKAVVKTVAKVVTAPIRLATKGILEIYLPKAAPSFLYLFVNDQNLINKMPTKARTKRAKQAKFADFVVNVVGMKRNHFMGIIRNGIMKRYKMSPEKKISQLMGVPESQIKGHAMGNIGIIDDIVKGGIELIKLISKIFKKSTSIKPEELIADESDWVDLKKEESVQLAKEVKTQPEAVEPGELEKAFEGEGSDDLIPESGGRKLFGIS